MDDAGEHRGFLFRFKWFILIGASLILFLLCLSILTVLPTYGTNPEYELSSIFQLTSAATQTNDVVSTAQIEHQVELKATTLPSVTAIMPGEMEVAYVTQVIDGDTIEVFWNGDTHRLRYIGIDSPEIGEEGSNEAAEENRNLIEGKIVTLEKDVSETDQYGRLLRYVYLEDGTFVNAELVKLGFAVAIAYPPDTKHQEIFNIAQQDAQKKGVGLWSTPEIVNVSPVPEFVRQVILDPDCSRFNAPGNDNENKNEEYVCFQNPGTEPIVMTGWQLGDEYGWVYNFPEYTLDANSSVRVRSGCGDDSSVDLYWCRSDTAVWNNDGDCVYLKNYVDAIQVEYCY